MCTSATSATTAATSRTKKIRHGFEKNWNRWDEPLLRLLKGGGFSNRRWLEYRRKKKEPLNSEI
jgi:hypothetical protein